MRPRHIVALAASIACAALAGCATSRSEVSLGAPEAAGAAPAPSTGKTALIRSVKDERVFEQAPRDQSVPSLGFEGSAQATAETKLRAIGRKRSGLGKALGDVLLQEGQTVETVVRQSLSDALRQAGYQVVQADGGKTPDLVVDAHIKQFWAYLRPGFWAITVSADIATNLDISGRADPLRISVHNEDARQIVTDGAWIEVVQKALQSYRATAAQRFEGLR